MARDAAAFGGLFALDAVFVDVEHRTPDLASARPIVGRTAIEAMTRGWLEETPAFEYEVEEVLSAGSTAAVRWRYRVSGIELDGVSWLRCDGGKILDVKVFFDSLGLYRGLGRA